MKLIRPQLLLTITLLEGILVVVGYTTNVYHFALVGALYEILLLPMLGGLIVLPVLSFIAWRKIGFTILTFAFAAFIISIGTLLWFVIRIALKH